MTFADELQSIRNEVAKLRQGEKLGAAYHRIGQLESALEYGTQLKSHDDFIGWGLNVEILLDRNNQNKQ